MGPLDLMQPGDLLIYGPKGIAGLIIRLKTWHPQCHCECYIGKGQSIASRDGIGVGLYQVRLEQLNGIYRPIAKFDMDRGLRWFQSVKGEGYNWLGLLVFSSFVTYGSPNKMFCSEFCTILYREMGINVVSKYEDPERVAPFELAESPEFNRIWASDDILALDDKKDKGVTQ